MTNETRRLLTEFIGEKYHEVVKGVPGEFLECSCGFQAVRLESGNVMEQHIDKSNRSFTDPEDAQVVKDKMVEKGLWRSFEDYINSIWVENEWKPFALNHHAGGKSQCKTVMQWLWSYTRDSAGNITGYRLCELVGEFLKGRNG